jgi:hypothetical protein
MTLRSVIKGFNLLNCILIAVCLLFAFSFLFPPSEGKFPMIIPPLKKRAIEKSQNESPKAQTLSAMDYVVIADENLFHPERKIPPEKKEEAALPKPEFVLYGTLITPDLKMAYMEDKKAPFTTPGRGKRQSALKIGESLSGFTLKEIDPTKVVLRRGEETMTVLLDDLKSPKTREGTAAAPGTPSQGPGGTGLGKSVHRPSPAGPQVSPAGVPGPTVPASPPAGAVSPAQPQPAFPGAVAPTPSTQAVPSRRQRNSQSNP